jgi:FkbH-like protein
VIRALDERGILQSIASKNDANAATAKLEELGLRDYFLFPEIHWDAKSNSVKRIQEALNIGLDTFILLDDQPFERDEVAQTHPEVECLDPAPFQMDYARVLDLPRLNPEFITPDSARRRLMYVEEQQRVTAEREFQGPSEEFLASLKMKFTIFSAQESDLQRAEELTVRTNQLNATGRTYSYDELNALCRSPDHQLLMCRLTDRYGDYGRIGLLLLEFGENVWTIKLLLMSCRVMSRGVGTVLLSYVLRAAHEAGVKLTAEFVDTGRNRLMYITYKFAAFEEVEKKENRLVLECNFTKIQPFPHYIEVDLKGVDVLPGIK